MDHDEARFTELESLVTALKTTTSELKAMAIELQKSSKK